MEINFDDFIPVLPPSKAMLKAEYEVEYESEDGIGVKIEIGCGEIVDYYQKKDGDYTISHHAVTLEVPKDVFPILFRPVDYKRLPDNMRYYSYDELSAELVEGWITWIHDFDQDIVVRAAVFEKAAGYILKMVIASTHDENGDINKAVVYRQTRYRIEDYGEKWAALRDRYEDEE